MGLHGAKAANIRIAAASDNKRPEAPRVDTSTANGDKADAARGIADARSAWYTAARANRVHEASSAKPKVSLPAQAID